ncbi:MAG TPA: AraC family transcriptional regulator, partial [Victivallales bacterium]|nr:AraC family transcriptional regulator [Victivallales bacterium]
FSEISSHKNPNRIILKNLFECWLLEMARLANKITGNQPSENIKKLKRYIDMHSTEKISLSQMSDVAAISIPHMCFEFKKYFGISPGKYLLEQKIELARYLLKNRELRISDVAATVGYNDIYQFSKIFKKIVGMSPRKFRKSIKD